MANPKGEMIGRLWNKFGDDWQRVWHGSPDKITGKLDSRMIGDDSPMGPVGDYFSPHRDIAETYRWNRNAPKGQMVRAEIPARRNFIKYGTLLKDMSRKDQDIFKDFLEREKKWGNVGNWEDYLDEGVDSGSVHSVPGTIHNFILEVGDPFGYKGYGKGKAGYVSPPPLSRFDRNVKDPFEYVVKDNRDFREIGRNVIPLVGAAGILASGESEAAGAGKLGRLWNQFDDDWQKVWHGSPYKVEGELDISHASKNYDESGKALYFSDDLAESEGYRKAHQYDSVPGTMIRAEVPGRSHLINSDNPFESREAIKEVLEKYPEELGHINPEDYNTFRDFVEDLSYEEFGGKEAIESVMSRRGIPGWYSDMAGEISIFDSRNVRELGRNVIPLAVGGGAAALSGEAEAGMSTELGPRGMMGVLEDRERGARDQEALESIGRMRQEPPAIYGPEHPRILGGIDAVRGIPGADFFAGGILDVGAEYAWGRESSGFQKAMAGLEVAGVIPVGKLVGMAGKKIGKSLGLGRMADDAPTGIVDEISDTDYLGEILTDADYPDSISGSLGKQFPDNVVDARSKFARDEISANLIRNEKTRFTSEAEAQAVRRTKDDPTAWHITSGRSGYELNPWPRATKQGEEIRTKIKNMTDEQWDEYYNNNIAKERVVDFPERRTSLAPGMQMDEKAFWTEPFLSRRLRKRFKDRGKPRKPRPPIKD